MNELVDEIAKVIAGEVGLRKYDMRTDEMRSCSWEELDRDYKEMYRRKAIEVISVFNRVTATS